MKGEPSWTRLCASDALAERGHGVRFESASGQPAFLIRADGRVYGYLNQCAHVPVELDWMPGEFFDAERVYLICATHGALYEPSSGLCVAGPCPGRRLQKVEVVESDDSVWLVAQPKTSA